MLDFVLNFLFPPVCGICGKLSENWLCIQCKKRIEKYEKFQLIKGKEKINDLFKFYNLKNDFVKNSLIEKDMYSNEIRKISNKKDDIYFDEFIYCFEYKNLIRNLLLRYKFSDCGYLSNMFANVILNNKKIAEVFSNYDIMIPVPMDKKKKKFRGYNQTELITNKIGNAICADKITKSQNNRLQINKTIEVSNKILIKAKRTKTQSMLNAKERCENIKNAFFITNKKNIENKRIIIFDDIATTGATVNEISKLLKESGAKKILVLVIAKD